MIAARRRRLRCYAPPPFTNHKSASHPPAPNAERLANPALSQLPYQIALWLSRASNSLLCRAGTALFAANHSECLTTIVP